MSDPTPTTSLPSPPRQLGRTLKWLILFGDTPASAGCLTILFVCLSLPLLVIGVPRGVMEGSLLLAGTDVIEGRVSDARETFMGSSDTESWVRYTIEYDIDGKKYEQSCYSPSWNYDHGDPAFVTYSRIFPKVGRAEGTSLGMAGPFLSFFLMGGFMAILYAICLRGLKSRWNDVLLLEQGVVTGAELISDSPIESESEVKDTESETPQVGSLRELTYQFQPRADLAKSTVVTKTRNPELYDPKNESVVFLPTEPKIARLLQELEKQHQVLKDGEFRQFDIDEVFWKSLTMLSATSAIALLLLWGFVSVLIG